MKIVLVSPFSIQADNISGGVAAVSQFLSDALLSAGHEVTIIAPGKSFGEKETRGKLNICWLGRSRIPGFLIYANLQRGKIIKILDTIKPDVVHFEGSFGWSIDCPYPYVVTIHGIAEKDAAFGGNPIKSFIASNVIKIMENKGRNGAEQVISISPYATKLLKDKLKGQIHHIDNPIDRVLYEYPVNPNPREEKLMCVGVVGERKNTLGVIDSFIKIKKYAPQFKLVVCGVAASQDYYQQCMQKVRDNNLENHVEFRGNLARDELYKELSTSKGLLMMSKQETAPMAIAESMVLGVPCLAPKEFGIPYMIDEGVNGWFVSESTDDKQWQRIADSLQGESWHKLSANALENAKRYHPDSVAGKTIDVYQQAISKER